MSWSRTDLNDVVRSSTFMQRSLVDWQAVTRLYNCSSEVTQNGVCAVKTLSQAHSLWI